MNIDTFFSSGAISDSKPAKKEPEEEKPEKPAKIEIEKAVDEEKEAKPKRSFKSHFKDL